jgi:hypothetical protein
MIDPRLTRDDPGERKRFVDCILEFNRCENMEIDWMQHAEQKAEDGQAPFARFLHTFLNDGEIEVAAALCTTDGVGSESPDDERTVALRNPVGDAREYRSHLATLIDFVSDQKQDVRAASKSEYYTFVELPIWKCTVPLLYKLATSCA